MNALGVSTSPAALDRVFAALADASRLRLAVLLLDGELCVCDLVNLMKLPQPTISRQLRLLRDAGLLTVRQAGTWHYYRWANPADSPRVELVRKLVESLAEQDEGLRLDRAKRAGYSLACPTNGEKC